MKRTFLAVLALLIVTSAYAASPMQLWNGSAWVPALANASGELKVTGTTAGTSGSVSQVAPQGATSVVGSVMTVTSTPASWTMTASATDILLQNLGATTVWIDFNSGGATLSAGMPLTATGTTHDMISRDAAQGVVVWLVASPSVQIYRAEGRR